MGNLVSEDKYTRTTTGMEWQNVAAYTYDETNRMVSGKNEQGEYSIYTYNGLGMRVGRELIMKDNTHGYTDFHDLTLSVDTGLTTPEVAVESYVIDYTSATFNPLTMDEDGGFSYRWVYGLDKLSVKITSEGTNWWGQNVRQDILKDYYHQDRLGSTTNLTDQFGRVVGRADYNEWGEITYREALDITSSYRRIWPQSSYTGHDWDDVLGMYYAKARFYSAEDKRFVAVDPVKGNITQPLSLVAYVYCVDNPLRWVDPLGLQAEINSARDLGGAVRDAQALPWETELVAKQGNLKLYGSYSPSSKVLATIPSGGSVFSQNEAKENAKTTWYKVSYRGQIGWVDASYFKEKASRRTLTQEDVKIAAGQFASTSYDMSVAPSVAHANLTWNAVLLRH